MSSLIYDDSVTHPRTKSLIIANEKNPSENVLEMYSEFWKNTPEYFLVNGQKIQVRPPLPPQFNNNPPKDRLVFAPPLSSRILVATALSLDAYLSFGFHNVHATEASRYRDGHELFRAVYPAISKEAHSALYVESTPNGQEGKGAWFYQQCMDAFARKKTEYGEMALVFIPWHEMTYSFAIPFLGADGQPDATKRERFGQSLSQVERDLIKRFPHIMLEQLAWRRMMLAGPTFNRDEDIFDQEYPTDLATAFLLSGSSVFGRKSIKRLMANVREPLWTGDIYWGESDEKNEREPIHDLVRRPHFLTSGQAKAAKFASHVNEGTFNNLRVYRWPVKGERIYIGCDIGQGNKESKDGDYSTISVGVLNELDRDELIMVWKGRINPIHFGEVCAALSWALCYRVGDGVPMPELAPEWTGPGSATCVYIDGKNLYPKQYRYQQPGVHKMPASKHVGWESNMKTKPYMIATSLRYVETNMMDIPDEELVVQMGSYRQKDDVGDTSSYGGAAGRHDDLVSSWQIMCALMRLRSKTVPGDSPVTDYTDYEQGGDYDSDDVPFDPFGRVMPESRLVLPGIGGRDADDESLEEGLFWGGRSRW